MMRLLCMCTLNICLIAWRGIASPANAAAERDTVKLEPSRSFLWTPLLGMLWAATWGNKGKEKFPPQEGTSLAGEHTDGGLVAPLPKLLLSCLFPSLRPGLFTFSSFIPFRFFVMKNF